MTSDWSTPASASMDALRVGLDNRMPARILLVEDHPDLATLVLHTLDRILDEPVVQHADTGERARKLLGLEADGPDQLPDLVLLDLKLPGLGGHELLEAIRAHPATAHLPVVVMSSSDDPGDRSRAYEVGANSFVSKPVEFSQFKRTVSRVASYWLTVNQPHPDTTNR